MKKLAAIGLVCMAASMTAFAETRTWTGGGDGTSWSSADNWDEKGAPVDGADDTVVIANSSGSALNIAIDGAFSLATIRITGKTSADAVTINETELTVTKAVTGASDYGIYVSSKAPVTFNTPIVIPEGVETRIAQMSYADAVDHANRKLVFNGAITGGGSLHVNAQYASHIE